MRTCPGEGDSPTVDGRYDVPDAIARGRGGQAGHSLRCAAHHRLTVNRDDFSHAVRSRLAARVGSRCSNPRCQRITSGPTADPQRALSIGVAAHVTAASPGGPRYSPDLSPRERSSIQNAIWLCQNCATLIDRDPVSFPIRLLLEWKRRAEDLAARCLGAPSVYRPIAASETVRELSIGQLCAFRALEEEFGCHVEHDLRVPTLDGWLRLDGAVVRGEDLVAIDMYEDLGRGIAFFRIEHLLSLLTTLRFPRFQGVVLFVVVVGDGPSEGDDALRVRLQSLAAAAEFECQIRMYRLNTLRASFGL